MNFDSAPWPRMFVGDVAVDLVDRELTFSLLTQAPSARKPLVVASTNLHHVYALRSHTTVDRCSLAIVLNRRRWPDCRQ